ncbi:transposase family protein [Amycolatopsis sp. NPDC051903]|uniref:transposase family protein n=1 Tax=Amycolatopsis sp. NPDC051903 TaxID=3363936 RepID=UPI0037A54F7C
MSAVPAGSACLIPAVFDRLGVLIGVEGDSGGVAGLREFLDRVPDPRHRCGVRHRVGSVLVLAAVAVAAGARSFAAIGEWAADALPQVLALPGNPVRSAAGPVCGTGRGDRVPGGRADQR